MLSLDQALAKCGEPSTLSPLLLCEKQADHKGERHTTSVFGSGSYTWGYVPTDEEAADV